MGRALRTHPEVRTLPFVEKDIKMNDETEDLQDTYPGAGTFKFGDSAALCQHLIAHVRQGRKTATCAAQERRFANSAIVALVTFSQNCGGFY